MNWPGLTCGLLLVGVVGVLWYRKHKASGRPARPPLVVEGLGLVGYSLEQLTEAEAKRLAKRLAAVVEAAWPDLQHVYNIERRYALDRVTFDTEYEHIIKLHLPGWTVRLRPQGGDDYTAEHWFARELHNLYRALAFGVGNVYPSDNEMEAWHLADDACILAAACLPTDRRQP